MKKMFSLTLVMVLIAGLLIGGTVTAMAAKPGDTVTGTFTISPGIKFNGYGVSFKVSDGLEFVSVTDTAGGMGSSTKIGGVAPTGLDSVTVTVTAKVKAGITTEQQIIFSGAEYSTLRPIKKYSLGGATRTITIDAPPAEETTPPPAEETTPPPAEETTPPPAEETTPPAPTWSPWKVRKEATCTAPGVEFRTMGDNEETRAIKQLDHKESKKWEVVRQATEDTPGLRVKKCTVCGTVLKQEEVPFKGVVYYPNNTVSSQGFYFREEVEGLTKEWHMFTPVDLSVDGEQTIPLIASNMYYVGNAKVKVAGGNVTVTYEYLKSINDKGQFLAILPNLASVKSTLPADLGQYAKSFGKPISIANELGGDTKVLIYIRNTVDYASDSYGIVRFTPGLKDYTNTLKELRKLMD